MSQPDPSVSPVPATIDELVHLRELLARHQELDRLQGNRIADLERELGTTQAKLRAAQEENRRLTTMLNGYRKD